MKPKLIIFTFITLLLLGFLTWTWKGRAPHPTPSSIQPITHIEALKPVVDQADKNTLVAFDVDYTLTTPKDLIARPKGLPLLKQLFNESGHKDLLVLKFFNKSGPDELLEPAILDLLRHLRQQGIPAVALTKMAAEPVHENLSSMDLRLSRLETTGVQLPDYADLPRTQWAENSGFYKGVIFAGKQSKGEALAHFLQEIAHLRPKQVIFIDDDLRYIETVAQMCQQQGIAFQGFHYQAAVFENDPEPDPAIAKLQVETLDQEGTWLSDAEAQARLEAKAPDLP